MFTKTIEPILAKSTDITNMVVVGTKVEYRFWGILLYKKLLFTPNKYGVKHWEHYQVVI